MKEFYKNHWVQIDEDLDGAEVFTIKTLKGERVGEVYDFYVEALEEIDVRADY